MAMTPEQRAASAMRALAAANKVRMARADVKDAIHADPSWRTLERILLGKARTKAADRMRILDLLTAAPALGPVKAKRLMVETGISPLVTGAELRVLAPERRRALVAVTRATRQNLNDNVLRAMAERPRDGAIRKDPKK